MDTRDIKWFSGDGDLPPFRREGNILYFPGTWRGKPEPRPETSRELCKEIAAELGLADAKRIRFRVLEAIRYANIKSTEELARVPFEVLQAVAPNAGAKTAGAIRDALRNKGYETTEGTARNAPPPDGAVSGGES